MRFEQVLFWGDVFPSEPESMTIYMAGYSMHD